MMKMTRKATSRLIRKRIAQRKAKDAAKHNTKHNTTPNNSIRGQLMNIAAQNIANGVRPFGIAPQQYGNINNERRIEQLRNDAQTKTNDIQNNNVILDTLQKQITELSADSKRMKKLINAKQSELDKVKHDKEMMDDKLHEAERIERDNERLTEQKRMGEKHFAEIAKDNHIIELKQKRLSLLNDIHQGELKQIEMEKQLEGNTIFNENIKLKNELDAVIAKHAYYDGILNSEEFKNPNKEHIEMMKQLAIAKERLRQQEELYKLEMENKQAFETLQSQPSKEVYEAISKEYATKRDEENTRAMELKRQQRELQDDVDMANYQHDQYMKARKDAEDEQHNLDMLRKEDTYMKNQLDKDGNNPRYVAQIEETANIRAKGLRKAIIVKMKQDLLKQKLENDTLEKVGEIMSEEPTEEERKLAKSIGENKARNEVLKEQQRLNNDAHAASLKLAEEQANKAFHNTPEYQQYLKDNADIKIETQKNLNKAEMLKMSTEYAKQMEQSRITYEITEQLVDANEPAAIQLNHHLQEATKIYQNMTEDLTAPNIIRNALRAKIDSFPERWDSFIELEKNERIPELLDNKFTGIDILKDIYYTFESYLGKTPPNSPPALKYQPRNEEE